MLRSLIAKCYLPIMLLIPNQFETLPNAVPRQQTIGNKKQTFPALPLHSRFSSVSPGANIVSKQGNKSKLELDYTQQTLLLSVEPWLSVLDTTKAPAKANNK